MRVPTRITTGPYARSDSRPASIPKPALTATDLAGRSNDFSSEARELAGQLGEIDAFALLDSPQLLEIASRFSIFALEQGEALVEQGAKGDSVFVLLEGRLSVTIGENGSAGQTRPQLEPGSIIGEVAMVAGGRRSATVRAAAR